MLDTDEVRLQGAPNFREFRRYMSADGRTLRRRQLFRSETLAALTAQDFETIAALEIRLICDLRSETERTHRPTHWPQGSAPDTLHMEINADLQSGDTSVIDILRQDPSERGSERLMMEVYRMIPRMLQSHLYEMFSRLADGHGTPMILHCTAGKDRTGVLGAVILLALGVSREDACADYLLTERFRDVARLEGTIAEVMRSWGIAPSAGMVTTMASVHQKYLEAALQVIIDEHGSVEGYLGAAGVDAAMLNKVRERLLET